MGNLLFGSVIGMWKTSLVVIATVVVVVVVVAVVVVVVVYCHVCLYTANVNFSAFLDLS